MRISIILPIFAVLLFITGNEYGTVGAEERKQEPEGSSKPKFDWNVPDQALGKTLVGLAEAQDLDPENYRVYRRDRAMCRFSENGDLYAVAVGDKTFAVAVQTAEPMTAPGGCSAQQVVLLTPNGKILDQVQCDINSRYGIVKTEILHKPDADGAQIVIRFIGRKYPSGRQGWWHNWHTIVFHDKFWTFWDEMEHKTGPHSLWNEKGLCRIGIADDKFDVLFPKLDMPEITNAKSLEIVYYVKDVEKSLKIADANQVSAMLADIKMKGNDQFKWRRGQSHVTVGFVMPDGTCSRWSFETPELLLYVLEADKPPIAGAGMIYLTSRAFYDAVSTAVSKSEGRHIELLPEKKENH